MVDYVIIGGGIIGLNIARAVKEQLPDARVVLIEKEEDVAQHSSGRNSGVLHAGFYYTADSLKARFTREGNARLQNFCAERRLRINRCAKVVVARNEEEISGLEELKRRGDINGVELEWLKADELARRYPEAKTCRKALFSPTTATIDPVEVTREFRKLIQEMGVEVRTGVKYLRRSGENAILTSKGPIAYRKLVNAAGLYADKIARDFGFAKHFVIIPFKGIYLKDRENLAGISTNIYPVPNLANPFLGVHYTLAVGGEGKIGPTAIPAFWRENYQGLENFNVAEFGQILYYEAKLFLTNAFGFRDLAFSEVRKYAKSHFLKLAGRLTNNLNHGGFQEWSAPGIRAQLLDIDTLELVQDFVVEGGGTSTHVLNAVSPALTSSMPFTEWVAEHWVLRTGDVSL
ncbi:MAG: L-2-hydroxyglutarate oxidase [Deltaproteobacteria bacterium]|nr:L-2-hydroxyglutarate oxidase [Deltaproteobacteria bacterium]